MGELVTLDGLPLSGVTRDGVWTVQTPIEGWFNRPAPKTRSESKTRGDGSYRTPVEYGSRQITVNGLLSSRNHDYLHGAVEMINAAGYRGGAQLLVSGHGPVQWAIVDPRPGSQVDTEFLTDRLLRFQIPLEAIDPFKYGSWKKFSASVGSDVAVFHRGNADAVPYVVVSGSMSGGYTLSHAGSSVVVTEPLVSGSPHTIDFRKRRLYKGGAPVRGGLSTASFASVAPGQRDTFSITPNTTGTATATMTLYDTYI